MACQPGTSDTIVLHLKRRDPADISLASSESSGCSSERSSILRSPIQSPISNVDETPVLRASYSRETSLSTDQAPVKECTTSENDENRAESLSQTSSPVQTPAKTTDRTIDQNNKYLSAII
uniref:Uncharacterized protein n=1 Tax=Heterorhabditis bacteriophora TaxID=37862 RepID=A0A1I7W6G4_HETBA